MFKYIRALFSWIGGFFSANTEKLQENRHVIAATFDEALASADANFDTLKNALADIMTIENQYIADVKKIGEKLKEFADYRDGALITLQKRVNALRGQGMTREQIEQDAEYLQHNAKFTDYSSTLDQIQKRFNDKDKLLKDTQKKSATLKTRLMDMRDVKGNLKLEKQETLAAVAVAAASEAAASRAAGITITSVDDKLAGVRDAAARVINRATVVSELETTEATHLEDVYLKEAQKSKQNSDLNKLIDWGEETETLTPAKLPE